MSKTFCLILGFVLVYVLAASFVSAQEQRGSINGTVFDPQGAVVPGASVTITDNGTGAVYPTRTTAEGSFTVPGLPFGSFSVAIAAPGFARWETKTVQVITAQESNVKATLQIGASTETVSVEAAQQVVDTSSSELTICAWTTRCSKAATSATTPPVYIVRRIWTR
jgi:hypothetical protein